MRKFVVKARCPKCAEEIEVEVNPAAMLRAIPSKKRKEASAANGAKNKVFRGGRPIDPNSKRQRKLRGEL
jgi:hypothetical protein